MQTTTQDEYKQQQHKTNTNNNNNTRRIQTTTQDEYTQQQHKTSTNKNNMTMRKLNKEVNKTWAFQQITGSKDETNIVYIRQSQRSSQHGIQNVKEHSKQVFNLQYSSVDVHNTSSIIQPSSFISIFCLHLRFVFVLLLLTSCNYIYTHYTCDTLEYEIEIDNIIDLYNILYILYVYMAYGV
jgi:hypothetical protein